MNTYRFVDLRVGLQALQQDIGQSFRRGFFDPLYWLRGLELGDSVA